MPPATATSVLSFRRANKQFGARVGLLDVTVDLQPGIVGLLGPNGAGKTTFLHLAAGLTVPSSGEVSWLGGQLRRSPGLDNQIAFVSDGDHLPRRQSPLEFVGELLRCAGCSPDDAEQRATRTLVRLGLEAQLHAPLSTLSRGQRQRAKLAQAFALPAALLLLDEPLNALDPVWRREVASLLRERAEAGTCVVISSHILEEVEALSDWLVLLFRGRLVAAGTQRQIQDLLRNRASTLRIRCDDARRLAIDLLGRAPVTQLRIDGDELAVNAGDLDGLYRALPAAVLASGVTVAEVATDGDDLVSLFQALSAEVR